MRWPRLLGGVAATVALLAGCSSSGNAGTTAAPPTPIQTDESAPLTTVSRPVPDGSEPELLSLDDLPAGWQVAGHDPTATSCPSKALARIPGAMAKKTTAYTPKRAKQPYFTEQVVTFQDPNAAFAAISGEMARCRHYADFQSGYRFDFYITPMSLKTIGDRSIAYKIKLVGSKGGAASSITGYTVFFERHGLIGNTVELGSSVHLDAFTALTVKAASIL